MGWQQRRSGELLVELRCPECFVVMQAYHTAKEMQELDRRQKASREEIVAAYERCIAESIEAAADNLREAFARDLVGPDDFRLPRAA